MKRICNIVTICLAVLLVLGTPISASAEDGRYDAEYKAVALGSYADMGVYSPGTYIISASHLPDVASNILDRLNFVCEFPIFGDIIPGCQYVTWAGRFLKVIPDTAYFVKLFDWETKELVWEGKLTSGRDELYLGDDHSCYEVKMAPTISGMTSFVYLAKK